MKIQLKQLMSDSPKNLESNKKIQEMVIHNIGYFLQIQSSYQICKKYFHDFDFRDDYWWRHEIRLLGIYYIDYFKDDFYPPIELRKFLYTMFSAARDARAAGVFDFVPKKYGAHLPEDVFKRVGLELAKVIRKTSYDSKAIREAHPRSFKDANSISEHLAHYAETFSNEHKDSEMNGSLINRFQFLPYYLAKNEEDLNSATYFMSAFYTLFTATNSYQTGAAQSFGPILGNNSTKQFINFVERWLNGESISKTGFKVHDSDSTELQDKSEYVAALEVYGFARLHLVPYVNKVVMTNYRGLFDLEDADGKVVQQRVGETVRDFLKTNARLVAELAELWDKYLSVAKKAFSLHFEAEKIQRPKHKEQYSSQLINNSLLEEFKAHLPSIGNKFEPLDKAQALLHLCLDANAYMEMEDSNREIETTSNSVLNYWSIAPGEGAKYWKDWKNLNIISLGWDEMGDLSRYETQEELKRKYVEVFSPERDPMNNTKALFEFKNKLKLGDIVFAKDGRLKLLGVGVITSEYIFEKERPIHNSIRKVKWLKTGDWNLENNDKFAIKALTNITEYSDFVEGLFKLAGVNDKLQAREGEVKQNESLLDSKNIIFWGPPGTGKTYKLLEMQNHFRETASSRDEMVSWIQGLGWWDAIAATLIDVGVPISVPDLFRHEFIQLKVKQQSTNKTPKNTLWGLLQTHTVTTSKTVNFEKRQEPLVVDKSADSKWSLVGDWKIQLDDLAEELKAIRSGKSDKVNERFNVVTFHQSYSYEEFVEGIRPERLPDGSGISYEVKDGVFKLLCQRAIENPDKEYAIFIDEINRGNISKIFGELITLIEEDKRVGAPHEIYITLPYSGERFGVPKNLYIIGTMNSVDRSIALVDMALRRRFEFVSVRPNSDLITPPILSGVNIKSIFEKLNQKISVILGTEYQIGHSYFMGKNISSVHALKKTWFGSILPLLQEYLFDDWDKLEALVLDFVQKTEVKELERLPLPRFSFGSFIDSDLSEDRFLELLKKLE